MHVLIAPDKFAGTLTAVQAADAIAEGWRRQDPDVVLDLVPMADGGPGFVDVLHATLGGDLVPVTVRGPYGDDVPAVFLKVGETAYVEAAQGCGLHLTPAALRDPERASSYGVGQLVRAAIQTGASTVVVGLGGSGTNDGGAGLLAALGATADAPLDQGPMALEHLTTVSLPTLDARLVAATDVDNPLLGLIGATNVYGTQKNLAEDRKVVVDAMLERLAAATDKRVALTPGAGAAGGLGFALLLLGAERRPGIKLVAEAVGLAERASKADLVVTGEGAFDFSSRAGKVPSGVAEVAAAVARPCIALAGRVLVGSRETRALGIESAHSVSDLVGQEASMNDPGPSLAALAQRVARSWSV